MDHLGQFALLTLLAVAIGAVPQFPVGLDPHLLRLQLEQARLSDCPSVLVAKPDPSCSLPDVTECRDGDGNVVNQEESANCRKNCGTQDQEEAENVVLGSDEFCSGEAASLECRNEMEYCVRLHCKPVKEKKCPETPAVETKEICTPTLSLSCLMQRQRRCQEEVGLLQGPEVNLCMRRPSDDGCEEYVTNHCVKVPVFKGQAGVCTVQIKRDCSQEDVRMCSEEFLGPKCRGVCQTSQEIVKRMLPAEDKKCVDKCKDMECKKVPNPACLRLVKERVCDN